jgi:hypothetical protein
MTEPHFRALVGLAGVKPNKVRAYLCKRPVNTGNRTKIRAALEVLARATRLEARS